MLEEIVPSRANRGITVLLAIGIYMQVINFIRECISTLEIYVGLIPIKIWQAHRLVQTHDILYDEPTILSISNLKNHLRKGLMNKHRHN